MPKIHVLLFSTPLAQKEGFWEGFSIPMDQLWHRQRGDTAMSPNSAHPQPCHPISSKTGISRVGKKPFWSSPTIPRLGNPRNCRGHEVFQLFQPSPGPPWNRGKIIIPPIKRHKSIEMMDSGGFPPILFGIWDSKSELGFKFPG